MTPSSAESKVRKQLRVIRFMQAYMPRRLTGPLNKMGLSRAHLPEGVTRGAVSADGVPCEWVIPRGSPSDRVLLYLHGGGFVFGQTVLHMEMMGYLAPKAGVRSLMVDYRVAPRDPYPAALDDCVAAYRWLVKQGIPAANIVVAGDSAGGNLAITTLMRLRDCGEALPAGAVCLSPVTDLSGEGHVSRDYKDPVIHPKAGKYYNKSYLAGSDPHNPLISPVFGDWRGLPPLLIHAGEDEILREDAVRAAELAKAAGVDVRLEIYPRMFHVWQIYPGLPEARQSLDDVAQFVAAHVGTRAARNLPAESQAS